MNIIYEKIQSASQTAHFSTLIWALQAELAVPAAYYPGFADWLNKVILELTEGMRSIVLAKFQHKIVAVNILKHHEQENKLCTFWVNPEFRHQHIASAMLDMSLHLFHGKAPLISIPEVRLNEFKFLIRQRGFAFRERKCGLYHRNVNEYFFTIPLCSAVSLEHSILSVSARHSSAAHCAG